MNYSLVNTFSFALLGSAAATPGPVNVFYTRLPAYHPYVIAQNADPVVIDKQLRNNTAALVKAGFNVRILFQGPEQLVTRIGERLNCTNWGVTGVGWGQRGATILDVVTRFEDNLHQYRENAPLTPTVFNWGPTTLAESVIRHVPLNEDCATKPGKLIAYEEVVMPS